MPRKKIELTPATNWFARDAKIKFEKHLLPIADRFQRYLECGVCCGDSMKWVLDNLPVEFAIGVDWWRDPVRPGGRRDKIFQGYKLQAHTNLEKYMSDGRLTLFDDSSKHFMATWGSSATRKQRVTGGELDCTRFDLIYCDGDHSGNGAMRDFLLAYELLAPATKRSGQMELATGNPINVGGILLVDDLQRSTSRKGKYEVRLAFDSFLMLMMGRMRLLWEDGRQAAAIRID